MTEPVLIIKFHTVISAMNKMKADKGREALGGGGGVLFRKAG